MNDVQNGHLVVATNIRERTSVTKKCDCSNKDFQSVVTKKFVCSIKDFKSVEEKLSQAFVNVFVGEKFHIHMDGVKDLECRIIFSFVKKILQPDILHYHVVLSSDENIKGVKVQGGALDNEHKLIKCQVPHNSIECILDKDGALNLAFKMTFLLDKTDESVNMARDYKEMLMNSDQYHADAVIHCKDGSIRVHKGVLAARSQYFKAMFATNMKEGLSGEIEVKHLEMSVCRTILEYIYSGKVEPGKISLEVFAEAEKIGLVNLKKECSTKLIKDLSIINCVKMIEAGDLHKDQNLKNKARQFIINNYENLSNDSKTELFHLLPDIARDIFESQRKDVRVSKRRRIF